MDPLVPVCITLSAIILLMLLLSLILGIKDKIDKKKREKKLEEEGVLIGIWAPGEYEEFINRKGDNNMEFKAGKKIEVGYEEPKTDPFGLLMFRMEMVETKEECDRCSKDLTIEEAVKLGKSVRYSESEEATSITHVCQDYFHDLLDYVADSIGAEKEN